MGSLVPGWNSVGNLPPIDMRSSVDEDEEPKGYFAKLQRNRSLRRTSTETAPAGPPDLSRRSAPLDASGGWSPRTGDALFGHPSSPVEMQRSAEWNDTLEVGSAPAGTRLDKYRSDKGPKDNYRWWKKLSSGFLNEVYEDEHAAKDKSNSFTPQYTVTGQTFNYKLDTKDSSEDKCSKVEDDDAQADVKDQQANPLPSISV